MGTDMCQRGRICLYDNVRFVLICLVVIRHCIGFHDILPGLYTFIYSFHMPAFIFLAGMFHKNKKIVPKIVSYLCIYFMLKVGMFLGNLLISVADEPFLVFSEGNVPWFIFVLAGYTAASYVLRNIDKRFLLLAAGVFGCFVGYDRTVGDYLLLSRGFVFYPFYVLGQMCGREQLAAVSRKPALRLAGGTILAVWVVICFMFRDQLKLLLDWNIPFSGADFPLGSAWRLLHYGVSLLLCFSVICVVPAHRLPVVTVMGQRTLQIYFWHWPIARAIDAVTGLGAMLCLTTLGRAAWVLFGISVTLLVGIRPFSFPTGYVLYYTGVRQKRPFFLPKEKRGLP